MKDILVFQNIQEMVDEADNFLTTVTDEDVKACAKLLLISCYAYMNDNIIDNAKKTYAKLAILVEHQFQLTGKLRDMIHELPDKAVAKRVYKIYDGCMDEIQEKATMHLMTLLLPYYLK